MKRSAIHQHAVSFSILLWLLAIPNSLIAKEVAELLPGMVKISTMREGASITGTGFVVGLDRGAAYVLTAAHVIQGGQNIRVFFYVDRFKPYAAPNNMMDGASDLAALWIPNPPPGLEVFEFNRQDDLKPGDPIHMIGFSRQASTPRVIAGNLSGIEGSLLEVRPSVEEGTSGAPLLHEGKIAGVVLRSERRFTHAVPAATVQFVLEQWQVPIVFARRRSSSSPTPREESTSPTQPQEIPQRSNGFPCPAEIALKTGALQPVYPTAARGSRALGKVPEGAQIEILNQSASSGQRWYKIRYGDLEGWIARGYVKLSSQCPQ